MPATIKPKKTPDTLAQAAMYETSGQNQQIGQRSMIGSIWEPGLVDQMLATSSPIALGWAGLSSQMGTAIISIDAKGASQEITEFIKEMLFNRLETRFQQVFINTLQALLYGVAPAEISLIYRFGRWEIADIAARPASGFDLYSIRKQSWWIEGTYRWIDSAGAVQSVECGAPWEDQKALMWWPVFGPGILGRSILRPVVDEWQVKCTIRKMRGNAISRTLYGLPILHARKRDDNEPDLNPDEIRAAQAALARASTGSAAALFIPDCFDLPEIKFSDSNAITAANALEDHCDLQTLMALGSSQIARGLLGGYASAGVSDADEHLADNIRAYYFQFFSQSMQQLIDFIIDLNFGPQLHYPELVVASPSVMSIPQLSRTMAQLIASGVIRPTVEDEEQIRKMGRLPNQTGNIIANQHPNTPATDDDDGQGIKGHYDSATGIDTRIDRDINYQEVKNDA